MSDDTEMVTVALVGGPLDGEVLEYQRSDLGADPTTWGAYMVVPGEVALPQDPGARAAYGPAPGDPCTWQWEGWVP